MKITNPNTFFFWNVLYHRVPSSFNYYSCNTLMIWKTSPVFDPLKFSGDTNFFLAHSEVQKLFWTIYQEISSISLCFTSNILSLNSKKSPKYSFFHKPSKTTKFCSMNTWTRKSTSKIEQKIAKNLELPYQGRPFWDRNVLLWKYLLDKI